MYIEYKSEDERERDYREWRRKLAETPEVDNGGEWLETILHEHEKELKEQPSLERENLIVRLKQMAEDEVFSVDVLLGEDMCYSPSVTNALYSFICPKCGREVKVETYKYEYEYDIEIIQEIIYEMVDLGYDVKVRRVCSVCSQREKKATGIDLLFYIRFKGMQTYHVALASIEKLRIVLAFLKGEYGCNEFIIDDLFVIEEMTGIWLCPKCWKEMEGMECMNQMEFDRAKETINLINNELGSYKWGYHIKVMKLCPVCCQTGIDMYLYVYIPESRKYNIIPASMEELKTFFVLWEKVRVSHDCMLAAVLHSAVSTIEKINKKIGEIDFHSKDSREGNMENKLGREFFYSKDGGCLRFMERLDFLDKMLDREFSYPKDDSCIRFVEHLDFLKKIVGIES